MKNKVLIKQTNQKTMKRVAKVEAVAALVIIAIIVAFASCEADARSASNLQAKVDSLQNELKKFTGQEAATELRLAKIDSLDFEYYSNQKWDMLANSHANDIKCYYPDGSTTTGLYPQHIDQLTPMFVFAPDTKCKTHTARFGSGDWTCVIEEIEGTFSKPMPIGNGKTIAPTGKHFKFSMTTVGHWGPDSKMTEEYLFWDNQSFARQIGLAK
jgi:hypothetical protein